MKIEHTNTPQTNSLRLAQCELDIERLKEHIAYKDQQIDWLQEDLSFVKVAFTKILGHYEKSNTGE